MIRHQLNQKQKTLKEIVVTYGGLSELSINTKSLFNASDCVHHIFYEIERFIFPKKRLVFQVSFYI